MASVQQRASSRWAARWRDDDGRQRWQTFATEAEATDFLGRLNGAGTVDIATTFAAFVTCWSERQLWRPGTRSQVDCYVRRYLVPQFGGADLCSVKPADVQVFVRQLSDRLSPSSVRLIVAHLRSMFNEAVRDGLVETSPVKGVRLPRHQRRLVVPPTPAQVVTLRSALAGRYQPLVDLVAGSGLRQGECLGLTLDRIDFRQLTIHVDRQLAQPVVVGSLFGPPKTATSVRVVPITETLADTLHAHVERYGGGVDGLLFTDADVQPLKRRKVSELWMPAAMSAGLPPRTGMHCLRHYYASLLIRAGCSVKVVQARLGHATATETLDTYAHLWPDDHEQTRLALSGVLSGVGHSEYGARS